MENNQLSAYSNTRSGSNCNSENSAPSSAKFGRSYHSLGLLPVTLSLSASILLLSACSDTASLSDSLQNKPTEYISSINILALASSDTSDVQTPWNARDTDLISMARSLPADPAIAELAQNNTIDAVVIDAITETVTLCTNGGTRTDIVNDVSPPWFSQGDINTSIYDNCINGNTTINGQRSYSVDVLTGQQFIDPDWAITTTMSRDMTRTDAISGNVSSNLGNNTVAVVVTGGTHYEQMVIGSSVRVRPNNGVDVTDTTTSNIAYTWDEIPGGSYTWNFDVTSSSTHIFLGSSTAKTLQTLTGLNYNAPEAGKIEMTKTLSEITRITFITATGAGNVLVEVDNEGDGIIDSSTTSSWYQVMLDPALYQYF